MRIRSTLLLLVLVAGCAEKQPVMITHAGDLTAAEDLARLRGVLQEYELGALLPSGERVEYIYTPYYQVYITPRYIIAFGPHNWDKRFRHLLVLAGSPTERFDPALCVFYQTSGGEHPRLYYEGVTLRPEGEPILEDAVSRSSAFAGARKALADYRQGEIVPQRVATEEYDWGFDVAEGSRPPELYGDRRHGRQEFLALVGTRGLQSLSYSTDFRMGDVITFEHDAGRIVARGVIVAP